jgi:salicylate hydroxylase
VPPNSSRLSLRWGVDFNTIKKEFSCGNRFLDWRDGRELLDIPFGNVKKEYGAPYYFLHRADLLNLLLKTAKEKKGITVKTGAKVVDFGFETPKVKTEDGTWYAGDLVVAADGIKSIARDAINGAPAKAVDTGASPIAS